MKLSVKALTYTLAILWGLCFLLVGLTNRNWPPYGGTFLELMSSVYPVTRRWRASETSSWKRSTRFWTEQLGALCLPGYITCFAR
jgi:hypothetical protein